MFIEPRNGNIVVVKTGRSSVTPGGIYLPETAVKESESAIVAAVCERWTDDEGRQHTTQFRVLDAVLVSKYAGEGFTVAGPDGKEKVFTILKESAVLGVLPNFIPPDNGRLPEIGRVGGGAMSQMLLGGEGAGAAKPFDLAAVEAPPTVRDDDLLPQGGTGGPQQADARPRTYEEAAKAKAELLASMM